MTSLKMLGLLIVGSRRSIRLVVFTRPGSPPTLEPLELSLGLQRFSNTECGSRWPLNMILRFVQEGEQVFVVENQTRISIII
jgi:hypothetical protein